MVFSSQKSWKAICCFGGGGGAARSRPEKMGDAGMSRLLEFLPCQLREFTGDFSEDNFLGKTQFGKLYRGVISDGPDQREALPVTVKIWENSKCGFANPEDMWSQLTDEVYFLQHPSVNGHHQNLAKPIGYSRKSRCLGIVYDINPRDTLHNLILKDNFTWLQRIKVSLQLARLLVFLHSYCPPFILRNISAAQIMVDEDCNPVLFDFGMLVGGFFGDERDISIDQFYGAPGHMDLQFLTGGGWSSAHDVFSYGVLLLSLFAKKVSDISNPETSVVLWAKNDLENETAWFFIERSFKHVREIFKQDPEFDVYDAYRTIRLALHCVEFSPEKRPTMKVIVESLQALHVGQYNGMIEGGLSDVVEFLPDEFSKYADGFHDLNFLGNTHFGKLYRGKKGEACVVTVKIWDNELNHRIDKWSKLTDELYLLRHPSINGHQQSLAKPIGYCRKCVRPGIVYDVNPRDTLINLIVDDKFTWLQRIKVALQFARLLAFFHNYDPPFNIRNISPANIVVDQENNPVLFDFGMLVGGLFGNATDIPSGKSYGDFIYVDPEFLSHGGWSTKCDVYSFGVILLSLIGKTVFGVKKADRRLPFFAKAPYEAEMIQEDLDKHVVQVGGIFKDHPGYIHTDAAGITKLALSCLGCNSRRDRPTMKETVECLQALHIVQFQFKELGI